MHPFKRFGSVAVKILFWLLPILPFYVALTMTFPFITGKNFAFRIVVEFAFAIWLGLAFCYKEYRPQLTWLVKAATLLVVVVFLADIFSPNPYRSFFSNYERMEGFMMLSHLYLYFVMLVSVFKTKRDWLVFFHVSIGTSVAVSLFALLQKYCQSTIHAASCQQWAFAMQNIPLFNAIPLRSIQGGARVDSSIGNPTYLAAYLFYHVWILGFFLYENWRKQWRVWLYGALLLFELFIIYLTATRGVVLALVATAILFAGSAVVFWNRFSSREILQKGTGNIRPEKTWSRGRQIAAGALVMMILVPLLLWTIRKTPFVQSSEALERLTNFSLTEGTINARFKIWHMAWQGFLERPFLGWGQENFYLVFQKYFDPGLYGEETWFDRAHNIIFDWLIHAGILGLISYLLLYAAALIMLWRAMQQGKLGWWHGVGLSLLFLGVLFQNLFVFDNLNTYLLFFGILAYTSYIVTANTGAEMAVPAKNERKIPTRELAPGFSMGIAGGALIAAGAMIMLVHVPGIRQSRQLIRGVQAYQEGKSLDDVKVSFERALAYRSFGVGETREQLGQIARFAISDNRFSLDDRKRFVSFAIQEIAKETERQAKDTKHLLFTGALYAGASSLDPQYLAQAEKTLQEAIRLSPTKQISYFLLSNIYLRLYEAATEAKQPELAQKSIEKGAEIMYPVWKLEKSFKEAGVNTWVMAALAGKKEIIVELERELPLETLGVDQLQRIATAYQRVSDFPHAAAIYAVLVEQAPDNPRFRAIYAALLKEIGNIPEARRQTEEAIKLDVSFAEEGRRFLETLK
ncbi:MAG: Uncharacterized protein G01um101466_251 [Parcubacteria group bacterium Gr01-1014_66]|nr:MAG: Uncharacterized protein G01um101466_251 [Parcubacteria group bacterium Gr01-1014_66]